ncbi:MULTISPECIES: hypothetical protein [Pseudomonas syringae group]|uniref:hypothetical protein n=1 Tax=Pseudomonas syringae group TaxID=136849 RepID=UPI000F00D8D1|nr:MULTISPECIES: hypothetical protein [Pseudomonas syringae group]MCH5536745.1 hypothetical protein [Pseudomonas syringae pv. syringae]MDF5774778.1 hypothetical protein [Pseudomonas syringae pv. syringae]MDU8608708.1 hypothetical protein [Pseudomonas syringae group sp. 247E2]
MTTLRITIAVNARDESDFMIRSHIKKQESMWASDFQLIGLAYREFDAVAKRITENPYAAKACFVRALIGCGVSLVDAETLLAAKGWERRMRLTWELLNERQRTEARSLDYTSYENYWPNLVFMDANYPSLI